MSSWFLPSMATPRSRSVRRFLACIAPFGMLSLAALAAGCGQSAATADPNAGAAGAAGGGRRGGTPPVPIVTTKAIQKDVPQVIQTVGSVEAYSTVEIRPQVSGVLLKVSFAEGQEVSVGAPLFTIDPQPYAVAVSQAEATLAKDAAQATNAEAIRKRNQDLLSRGILSQQDYDTSATQAASLKASVQVDQAQIDNAKLQLQYTKITAPVSGRTGALLVHEGNLIRTTDTSAMVVINQITPIRVTFGLPAIYLTQVRSQQAVAPLSTSARAAGSTDAQSIGKISFLDNAVDSQTGTLKVKGTFPNTDRRLWPGELVEVSLQLSVAHHAVVVPAAAVQTGQQGQYVYLVKADRTVAYQAVQTSIRNGDDVVVLTGLKAGDEVVTDGQLGLTPGAMTQLKSASGSTAPAPAASPAASTAAGGTRP
jgi:multidrug efflux system membrane fusion protein